MKPLVIGLTGGIASGKSTVAGLFQDLGATVVDADEAARAVVAPGSAALAEIRAAFGDTVIAADGTLDRARLRAMVFDDSARRQQLEAILHPRIRAWMDAQIQDSNAPYVIRMVPLLIETQQHRNVDRVLVVDVPRDTQLARAMTRDDARRDAIERILAAQAGRDERLALADDVIRNDGHPSALEPQVRALHERYLALAARLRRDRRK